MPERGGPRPGAQGPSRRMRDVLARLTANVDGEASARYRGLCAAAVQVLPVRGASLSLMTPDGASTLLAASDTTSERVADLAFTTGEGPSKDAFAHRTLVLEPDLELSDPRRWPGFLPAVLELGVRSLFVFPLQVGAIRFGTLCLDGERPGSLADVDLVDAVTLTDAALLSVLDQLGNAPTRDGWVHEVGGYLNEVHQATGMVMVQLGSTAEYALLRLRGHAFASGLPLAAVASDVVARRLKFDREE